MNEIAKVKKEVKLAQWTEMVKSRNESRLDTLKAPSIRLSVRRRSIKARPKPYQAPYISTS